MKIFTVKWDWWLVAASAILSLLGLVAVTSLVKGLFPLQIFYLTLGWGLFLLFSQIDYRIYEKLAWFFYLPSLIFLWLPLLFGTLTRGVLRWLTIGPFGLQPSELLKPFLIIFFAYVLSSEKKLTFKKIISVSILLIPPIFLIFIQPDLGSALIVLLAWIGILWAAGISLPLMVGSSFGSLLLLPVIWKFLFKEYQRQRIFSFFRPLSDPLGASYHLIQAKVAVGSGQFWGRGLGRGTQSSLRFLPERHTDFIFASFAEDLGFLGVFLLLVTFGLLLFRILKITHQVEDNFGRLLGLGIFSLIFFQFFINISMNLGLLPITGVTLPLVSYGGSSYLATMISLGIVENLASLKKKREEDIITIH